MKLMHDLINRRMEVYKDLDLNNENIKSIWHFYQIYLMCINILGVKDPLIKKKIIMTTKLLNNSDNLQLLNTLKRFISEDSPTIEKVLATLEFKQETIEIFEDFFPDDVFGVNINDRGN
jgi:hypothetical protein